jgi:hypothetical protein
VQHLGDPLSGQLGFRVDAPFLGRYQASRASRRRSRSG